MPKLVDYKIVYDRAVENVQDEVMALVAMGYELHGSLVAKTGDDETYACYAQPMVKYELTQEEKMLREIDREYAKSS